MSETLFPKPSLAHAEKRRALAPETEKAFQAFSRQVFADGALTAKTKQLIAVAVAHVTQCPYCITGHTKAALRHGATAQELMEAIWVAAEMRAGGRLCAFHPGLDRDRGDGSRRRPADRRGEWAGGGYGATTGHPHQARFRKAVGRRRPARAGRSALAARAAQGRRRDRSLAQGPGAERGASNSGSATIPAGGKNSGGAIWRNWRSRPRFSTKSDGARRAGELTLIYAAKDEAHNQAVVLRDLLAGAAARPPRE